MSVKKESTVIFTVRCPVMTFMRKRKEKNSAEQPDNIFNGAGLI